MNRDPWRHITNVIVGCDPRRRKTKKERNVVHAINRELRWSLRRRSHRPHHALRTNSRPCYGCCYPFVPGLLRVRPQFPSHFTDMLRVLRLQRGEGGYISTGEVLQNLTGGSRDNRGFDFLLRGLCLLLLECLECLHEFAPGRIERSIGFVCRTFPDPPGSRLVWQAYLNPKADKSGVVM